jgi:ankyrin repeat protein
MKILVEKYDISRLKEVMLGTVAFLVAAREGELEAMKFFLDAGLDVEQVGPLLDEREDGPYTALCEAIRGQQVEMVQLLLDRGAKWDTPCRGRFDATPSSLATQHRNRETCKVDSC